MSYHDQDFFATSDLLTQYYSSLLKEKVVFTLILSKHDRTDPLEEFPITLQNFYWISFWKALKP